VGLNFPSRARVCGFTWRKKRFKISAAPQPILKKKHDDD
jgi:hypothetical protein